jgi:N-acetylglucosamine-6-phosphate deacetylase
VTTQLLRPDALVLDHAVAIEPLIEIEDGRVLTLRFDDSAARPGARRIEGTLMPGLVDLQVNGAGGRAVDEASTDALDHIAMTVKANGASAFLPTLITAPFERLVEQIAAVAAWITERDAQSVEGRPDAGAVPLGLHVEGPFLSNAGAHPPDAMIDATPDRIDRLLAAGAGTIRLVTLSPSRDRAAAAVSRFRAAGVTVSLGHGRGQANITECVAAGATMATHLFNAMGPSDHREPGMAGRILDDADLSCSLIVDDIHVHPMRVRQTIATIGIHRTVLVSDAVSAMGMPDGEYALGTSRVTLRDGAVRNSDGTLAGSALTMAAAVENFARAVPTAGPWSLARVASTNPARLIGAGDWGHIAVGARASFARLDVEGTVHGWEP